MREREYVRENSNSKTLFYKERERRERLRAGETMEGGRERRGDLEREREKERERGR